MCGAPWLSTMAAVDGRPIRVHGLVVYRHAVARDVRRMMRPVEVAA
jgi:hypothetical protein